MSKKDVDIKTVISEQYDKTDKLKDDVMEMEDSINAMDPNEPSYKTTLQMTC